MVIGLYTVLFVLDVRRLKPARSERYGLMSANLQRDDKGCGPHHKFLDNDTVLAHYVKICPPSVGVASSSTRQTRVDCFIRHYGISPELFCSATDIIMDVSQLQVDNFRLCSSNLTRGFLKSIAACHGEMFKEEYFHYNVCDGARILINWFEHNNVSSPLPNLSSAQHVPEVVYILSLDHLTALTDPWYGLEVVVHMYESMRLHALENRFGRVVILGNDFYNSEIMEQINVYARLISTVFSHDRPLKTLVRFLQEKNLDITENNFISFERIIFLPQHYDGILKEHHVSNSCARSSLMVSFVRFVLGRLPGVEKLHADRKRLLLLHSSESHTQKFSKEVFETLQRLLNRDFRVKLLDLSQDITVTMSEVRESSVVIGFSGVQLTHTIWMREGGSVLELTRGYYCNCYSALASWLGLQYRRLTELPSEPQDAAVMVKHHVLEMFHGRKI